MGDASSPSALTGFHVAVCLTWCAQLSAAGSWKSGPSVGEKKPRVPMASVIRDSHTRCHLGKLRLQRVYKMILIAKRNRAGAIQDSVSKAKVSCSVAEREVGHSSHGFPCRANICFRGIPTTSRMASHSITTSRFQCRR
ncbi:hypothetical protein CEXT_637011 [Caerostris extrusa]|uniref:Secreted protein n=1 Tax=Caerostris extrusa TaxID=172846 RepID=A0AAV4TCU3_CAEEX|nr:hypothetical protein CEXT_637011 [Caerostris extrusa]